MLTLIPLLTLIGLCCVAENNANSLQLLHIITRHGARAPIFFYPNDPNREEFKEGLGQLTKIGKLQQYNLGKYFRERYAYFITSNPTEVVARSSDVDRTIMSALCHLAGLYAPSKQWQFSENLQWQPITILTSPLKTDGLLNILSKCPEASAEERRLQSSPEGEVYRKKYTELFSYVSNHTGMIIQNWFTGVIILDAIKIEKSRNMIIPDWITEEFYEKSEKVLDELFSFVYKSVKLQRLRTGLLLGEIVKNMREKDRDQLNNSTKVYAYFTHDANIAVLLSALKIFNGRAPPFCAAILVEFHKFGDSSCVKVFYSNATNPESGEQNLHLMTLPDCELECCPLDNFVNIADPLIPTDWEKECELQTDRIEDYPDSVNSWWSFDPNEMMSKPAQS